MIKVLSIFGTRPEVVKMAPVVKELERHEDCFQSRICVTAQHRGMLDQMLAVFEIDPEIDLDLMQENQTLSQLTSRLVFELDRVIDLENPEVILVQGDTTTVMAAGLVAFYRKIPVGHVEAGLRSGDRWSPFPEEVNRRICSLLSELHFAPTETAKQALLAEGVPSETITVTGNTVVDSLFWIMEHKLGLHRGKLDFSPRDHASPREILVTAHRRENFGEPLQRICMALKRIAEQNDSVRIIYPVHKNPNVQRPVRELLGRCPRVELLEPLEYTQFVQRMVSSYLVLTDSGGVQEEAPALGKPVLVLREETERPEGVAAGTARLVGTSDSRIVSEVERLLVDPSEYEKMANAVSPYGDGTAAGKIVSAIRKRFEDE